MNDNNYVELDRHVEEVEVVEVDDGDHNKSGINTEVVFSYETASIYNNYLKN